MAKRRQEGIVFENARKYIRSMRVWNGKSRATRTFHRRRMKDGRVCTFSDADGKPSRKLGRRLTGESPLKAKSLRLPLALIRQVEDIAKASGESKQDVWRELLERGLAIRTRKARVSQKEEGMG